MKSVFFRCLFFALLSAFLSSSWAIEQAQAIPDCKLTTFGTSDSFNLKQYQGKVVYVDFWASWCGPCAKSFPFLNNLNKAYKEQGLTIIGVNLDENTHDADDFLTKVPPEFSIASDGQNQQCAQDFGVKAMPSSYIIDRKGVVRHIHLGFKPGETDEIIALVKSLLAEP
ncbi:TlpA family protein disulfide reductase [Methylocucumis oryzae]|uniref:Redoxin n=1 Tax=Methylocucumis oryzae TaxID=1632867 RepID=A0A0F3IIF0_9GAMM|nr:TlpA disulfide reductase family protein [Methylocucumis oryzae]KJV06333.1 redoxin [Methylocucumis oryzae]